MRRRTAGSRASTKSIHKPARSLRRFASLLSTFPTLAGVAPETSRSIKPRERDLRDLRLFFWSGFLRGQRTILDMPPALPTMSRSQCAPKLCLNKYRKLRSYATSLNVFVRFSLCCGLCEEQSEWQWT